VEGKLKREIIQVGVQARVLMCVCVWGGGAGMHVCVMVGRAGGKLGGCNQGHTGGH
jgi:hypothetical protein